VAKPHVKPYYKPITERFIKKYKEGSKSEDENSKVSSDNLSMKFPKLVSEVDKVLEDEKENHVQNSKF